MCSPVTGSLLKSATTFSEPSNVHQEGGDVTTHPYSKEADRILEGRNITRLAWMLGAIDKYQRQISARTVDVSGTLYFPHIRGRLEGGLGHARRIT